MAEINITGDINGIGVFNGGTLTQTISDGKVTTVTSTNSFEPKYILSIVVDKANPITTSGVFKEAVAVLISRVKTEKKYKKLNPKSVLNTFKELRKDYDDCSALDSEETELFDISIKRL